MRTSVLFVIHLTARRDFTVMKAAVNVLHVVKEQSWMEKILKNIEYGKGKISDIDLLWDIQRKIEGNTICPLGDAAAWLPLLRQLGISVMNLKWHVLNPEESQRRNYGLAHYA